MSDDKGEKIDWDEWHAALDAFQARYKGRVELKSVKVFEAGSRETTNFAAMLYLDGKKVGRVANDGGGGPHEYDDWTAIIALTDEIKALEQAAGRKPPVESIDLLISAHIENWRMLRDARKWSRAGKVAFRCPGDPKGSWTMVRWPELARDWPKHKASFVREATSQKYNWFKGHAPSEIIFANDLLVPATASKLDLGRVARSL